MREKILQNCATHSVKIESMKLVIFLGNPGEKFEKTRHNAGFLFAEFLRESWKAESWHFEKKFSAEISVKFFAASKVLLARPQTFMNLSGNAAQKICNFFHILPENVLLIFDDKDIEFGKVRFRASGSAGGHNGVTSVLEALGTSEISRLKIGVETREEQSKIDTKDFVLSKFSAPELATLQSEIFPLCQKNVESWLEQI